MLTFGNEWFSGKKLLMGKWGYIDPKLQC